MQPLNEHRALPEKHDAFEPETMPRVKHDMSRKQAVRLARRLQDENEQLGETLKYALSLMTAEQRTRVTSWAQDQL